MPPGDPPGLLIMALGIASGKRRKKSEFGWFAKLSFCSLFAIFGSPLGSPKPPEIDFFLKKTSQGMLFCRFLPRIAFTLIFWTIFHRFWMKFERKNRWFFQAVLAFPHLAKTMRFAGYPAWGQCFYENAEIVKITYFFEKSMKKTIGNLTCRKTQKTTSWESRN